MTLELIKCPYCGYKYHTDMTEIVEDGEAVAVRLGFSDIKKLLSRKTTKSLNIDIVCPNCKKEFEWKVKT